MKTCLGRHVLGSAAILFGLITLAWRDFNSWQQIQALGNIPHREILAYFAAAIEILGGLAIQWHRTARAGAAALGCVFLIFALLWVPSVVADPRVFGGWGSFFEEFSQFAGALIVYAAMSPSNPARAARAARAGCVFFGICVVSFTVFQVVYLSATVMFVPKWIPLGQMFWAIATTVAFALAAIAILSGRVALLASRLLTAMIIGFGLLVWLPALFNDPHKLFNWAGNAQNLAIAGAAWVVTDYFSQKERAKRPPKVAGRPSHKEPQAALSR